MAGQQEEELVAPIFDHRLIHSPIWSVATVSWIASLILTLWCDHSHRHLDHGLLFKAQNVCGAFWIDVSLFSKLECTISLKREFDSPIGMEW